METLGWKSARHTWAALINLNVWIKGSGRRRGRGGRNYKRGNLVCCWIFDPLDAILYYQRFSHFVNSFVELLFQFFFSSRFFLGGGQVIRWRAATQRVNSMISKKKSKANLCSNFVCLVVRAGINFIWGDVYRNRHHRNRYPEIIRWHHRIL